MSIVSNLTSETSLPPYPAATIIDDGFVFSSKPVIKVPMLFVNPLEIPETPLKNPGMSKITIPKIANFLNTSVGLNFRIFSSSVIVCK